MPKPILCLDFDGVLHSYKSGWKGAAVVPDEPVAKMVPFLEAALAEFDVRIFSSRSCQDGGIAAMQAWLRMHVTRHFDCEFNGGAPAESDRAYAILDAIGWPIEKPSAMVTIDDRALTFDGTWPRIEDLRAFQPWNKRATGATGTFPHPALDDDDQGALNMSVAYDPVNGIVAVQFGKPVASLGMPPSNAIELARALLRAAGRYDAG